MPDISRRFLHAVRRLGSFDNGSYAVAVSGGCDSVALLTLLTQETTAGASGLTAVHVHHHTRGSDADDDAAFVQTLTEHLGCACIVLHVHPSGDRPGEDELRRLRYHALETCIAEQGFDGCFMGHTADDQTETVLMRLLDGTGLRGLAGIPPRRGPFIRPLLSFYRDELQTYLDTRGIGCRYDASNDDRRYRRNALRHDVLPHIAAVEQRDIRKGILATSAVAADADTALRSLLPPEHFLTDTGDGYRVSRLRSLTPEALGFAVKFIAEHRWPGPPPRITVLQRIREIIVSDNPQATAPLGDGRSARRLYDTLFLQDTPEHDIPEAVVWREHMISGPGEYVCPCGTLTVSATAQALRPGDIAYATDAAFPFVMRPRRGGDRVGQPAASLKKRFINLKIPRQVRDVLPVIEHDDAIIWIPGVFGLKPAGTPVVHLCFTPRDRYRGFTPFSAS